MPGHLRPCSSRYSLKRSLMIAIICCLSVAPVFLQAASHKAETQPRQSDFARAVQAVKEKNYQLAINLFEAEAARTQFEAMYNLALLLKVGKGRPQNYTDALYWAYLAQLGGVELAQELAEELTDRLNEKQTEPVIERVRQALVSRINEGDFATIPQFAAFHLTLLGTPDYEQAYHWYAIAVALGQTEMIESRDDTESEIDPEKLVDLQIKTTQTFERLMKGEPVPLQESNNEN